MNAFQRWLKILELLGGVAGKFIPGPIGLDVEIGTDLLQVAQNALLLQSQLTGQTQDQVLAQLHDLPPLP